MLQHLQNSPADWCMWQLFRLADDKKTYRFHNNYEALNIFQTTNCDLLFHHLMWQGIHFRANFKPTLTSQVVELDTITTLDEFIVPYQLSRQWKILNDK